MRIRDLIEYLRSDMEISVRQQVNKSENMVEIYRGQVENMPYWVVEKSFRASECIEIEDEVFVIDISPPAGGFRKDDSQSCLEGFDEEEVLLFLAGFLYHYDVGIVHDEQYDDDEWRTVFSPMIDYVEKRIGTMAFTDKMHDWFRSKSLKRLCNSIKKEF